MYSSNDLDVSLSKSGLMVVDDDEDILFTVQTLFKKSPFPVFLARSGQECLEDRKSVV